MIIKAVQRNTRQAPRKVRLAANAVKDLSLVGAIEQLSVMEREASLTVLKVLRQAVANATHNYNLQAADLQIKNIYVDGGQQYKRWRAVSRGRAHSITKKTCHITVELEYAEAQPEDAASNKHSAKPDKSAVKSDSSVKKIQKNNDKSSKKSASKTKTVDKKETNNKNKKQNSKK